MLQLTVLHLTPALVPGPWSDGTASPTTRAKLLLGNMTLDEKLTLLHGPHPKDCAKFEGLCAYVGNVAPIKRLGMPPINMNDGPQGFRVSAGQKQGTSTAFPSGLTMAASWDVELLEDWGAGMGKEFYAKGSNVQLGPGLCLARVPRNGRNFEYLSGEDPYLGFALAQPAVRGIQSQKVVANAKHWVLNNQETNRGSVDELASERTRFEMYYPPFMGAIAAGVGSVMCSYNKINGNWSCENPQTLAADLKGRLGFEGFVMSDWGATHSTSLAAGLDVEMPGSRFMSAATLNKTIAAGGATLAQVDDAVTRILTPLFAIGVMDEPLSAWDYSKLQANATSAASVSLTRKLAAGATVLLKNADGLLPLRLPEATQSGAGGRMVEEAEAVEEAAGDAAGPGTAVRSIAVIGFASPSNTVVAGGGSGTVIPSYIVSPLEGIRAAASGTGANVSYDDGSDQSRAAALAKSADVAIVFVQTISSEGYDRPSLSLDDGCAFGESCHSQNALVWAVSRAQRKTVVVMSVPGAVLTPWRDQVGALLTNFMPGQQVGHAIADVLFGAVNPSAKLPLTFPGGYETPLAATQWPGWPNPSNPTYASYSEELLVGYRYYDAHQLEPAFSFGHGLSYAAFAYADLEVTPTPLQQSSVFTVSFTLTNTAAVGGAEVVQLYLSFPPAAGSPPRVLRRFVKVFLKPGQSKTVTFEKLVAGADMAMWDVATHNWKVVAGKFGVLVGASSRDVRLQGALDVS